MVAPKCVTFWALLWTFLRRDAFSAQRIFFDDACVAQGQTQHESPFFHKVVARAPIHTAHCELRTHVATTQKSKQTQGSHGRSGTLYGRQRQRLREGKYSVCNTAQQHSVYSRSCPFHECRASKRSKQGLCLLRLEISQMDLLLLPFARERSEDSQRQVCRCATRRGQRYLEGVRDEDSSCLGTRTTHPVEGRKLLRVMLRQPPHRLFPE